MFSIHRNAKRGQIYYFAISRCNDRSAVDFRTEVLKSHFNSIRRRLAYVVKFRKKADQSGREVTAGLSAADARREIHRRKEDETTRIKAEILGTTLREIALRTEYHVRHPVRRSLVPS